MRVDFKLPGDLTPGGFAAESAGPGGTCTVITTEGVTSFDGALLTSRLEGLHDVIFRHIPDLPPPSQIDNLLVIIRGDLTGIAYINELATRMRVKTIAPTRPGEMILVRDITDITSLHLGIDIPTDCGFVLIRSFGWRRSLFYDLAPLDPTCSLRQFDVPTALARQALLMVKGDFNESSEPPSSPTPPGIQSMGDGFASLTRLLGERCAEEAAYQELFCSHPWFFGGLYRGIIRHKNSTMPISQTLRRFVTMTVATTSSNSNSPSWRCFVSLVAFLLILTKRGTRPSAT